MSRAFEQVFGVRDALSGISMNGRTDAWILAQMAERHGFRCEPGDVRTFHDTYVGFLKEELERPGPRKGVMPGVSALLDDARVREMMSTWRY